MSASNSRKATAVIAFRATPEELENLKAAALMTGLGHSSFARRAAFAAAAMSFPAYEKKAPDNRKRDLVRINGQLGRMASNLNQLTRVANAAKTVPERERRLLRVLFAELRALREDILAGEA